MLKQLIRITLACLCVALAAPVIAAQTVMKPLAAKTYSAIERPDTYTQNHVWSELFTLPAGFNAYDNNNDFADLGLSFTYENDNPDLVVIENCGYDPGVTYRRNQLRYHINPMVHGKAVVTVYAHYQGETVSTTLTFDVAPVSDNPYTPREGFTIYNATGVLGTADKSVTTYASTFFTLPSGWDDPSAWESLGITWGAETDNTDMVTDLTTAISGKYAQIKFTLKRMEGEADIRVWIERNGVRKYSTYHSDQYAVRAKDDESGATFTAQPDTLAILSNDSKIANAPYSIEIIEQPRYGKVELSTALDTYNRTTDVAIYRFDSAEKPENWTPDTYRYRLTVYNDAEKTDPIAHSDATVTIVLRNNPAISRIWEFVPAPGQFINSSGFTSADCLIGSSGSAGTSSVPATEGMISLGSFGGYVIVGFDAPIPNDPRNPYGVDFTIGGNAFKANVHGYWSEPGAVMVMRDDNGNGLPDDTWYELAGSDYWWTTTRRNITMTYEDPGYTKRYTIPYTTSDGEHRALTTNGFHAQNYFPEQENYPDARPIDGKLSYTGTLIKGVYDRRTPSYIESYRAFAFGYCDNHATNGDLTNPRNPYYAEGDIEPTDGFDISWAVDADGNYVDLDHIDFIKIYCASNEICGWLGESSTEVAGLSMSRPDFNQTEPGDYYINYAGITQLQVIEGKTCQFEGFAFHNGKPMREATATWSVDNEEIGTIDQNGLFTAKKTGTANISFRATDLAPADVFEVEVVTLDGLVIDREGNQSSTSNTEMDVLIGEKHWINTESTTTNTTIDNGTSRNRYIYDQYTWTSSAPDIVKVENNGYFYALQLGEATLTVVSQSDPSLTASIKVRVNPMPEVQPVSNYVVISDQYYTQESLNSNASIAADKIFNIGGKRPEKVEVCGILPDGYDDRFYYSANALRNRLVKGDAREYVVSFDVTFNDVTTSIDLPVLHVTNSTHVNAPHIADIPLKISYQTLTGSVDLRDIFVINSVAPQMYTHQFRLDENELPEGVTAELTDGILTVSTTDYNLIDGNISINVSGKVNRASTALKAEAQTPEFERPDWHSTAINVIMDATTGVAAPDTSIGLAVYPNPAEYFFTLNNSEPVAIELYTAAGGLVTSLTLEPGAALDIRNLPAGIYLVVCPDAHTTLKLIKK